MNPPVEINQPARRTAIGGIVATVFSSAAIGGVAGFVANQIADHFKHKRDIADDLMKEEVKDARAQLLALADELKAKPPKSSADVDTILGGLITKQKAFKTPQASSMIAEEVGRLKSVRAEFFDSETSRREAEEKEAQRKAAQDRKDAEAASKAAIDAAQRSAKAQDQADRAELMLQRTEERIRHAKGF